MTYLNWDDIKKGDIIYDNKNHSAITVKLKFYNVYGRKMIEIDSNGNRSTMSFDDSKFYKQGE